VAKGPPKDSPNPEPLPALFGRRVRLLREAAGLTQQELGAAAGVDFKHVGSIERGEKAASLEAVAKLADALGASYYELFLPDEIPDGPVDATTRAAIRDLERLSDEPVKRFVRDVLAAARKLGTRNG
jgi:transcriptional regulator with XRE-family HTH domain